jgi:hypothetical protein
MKCARAVGARKQSSKTALSAGITPGPPGSKGTPPENITFLDGCGLLDFAGKREAHERGSKVPAADGRGCAVLKRSERDLNRTGKESHNFGAIRKICCHPEVVISRFYFGSGRKVGR